MPFASAAPGRRRPAAPRSKPGRAPAGAYNRSQHRMRSETRALVWLRALHDRRSARPARASREPAPPMSAGAPGEPAPLPGLPPGAVRASRPREPRCVGSRRGRPRHRAVRELLPRVLEPPRRRSIDASAVSLVAVTVAAALRLVPRRLPASPSTMSSDTGRRPTSSAGSAWPWRRGRSSRSVAIVLFGVHGAVGGNRHVGPLSRRRSRAASSSPGCAAGSWRTPSGCRSTGSAPTSPGG